MRMTASRANPQNASRGVATTANTNSTVATTLHSGASRCTPESVCTNSTCECPCPPPMPSVLRLERPDRRAGSRPAPTPADREHQSEAEGEAQQHPDHPGQPGGQPAVVDAADRVVGQRTASGRVVGGVIREALIDGD